MSRCLYGSQLQSCPSSLPQPTAESQKVVGALVFTEDTLDKRVIDALRQFVLVVRDKWERRARGERVDSAIAYIKGMWGYGKSFYARLLVEKLAPEMGVHAVYEVFDNIKSGVYELIRQGEENPEVLSENIARRLLENAPSDRPVIAVIDEVESLVTAHWSGSREERLLVDAFIHLYQSLVNPDIQHLSWARGKLHLALVLTPAASMRLGTILDEAMKGGKLLRRYDVEVNLYPAPKYTALRIAAGYLARTLGIRLEDLIGELHHFNSLYYATGGSPGSLILLINSLARESASQCPMEHRDCCVCTLQPRQLAEALSTVEIVSPEGDRYRPGTELLRTISGSVPEPLLSKLLALAPLGEEEANRLQASADIRLEPVTVYGPTTPEGAASWVDHSSEALCGGREECRAVVRHGLQYMIYIDAIGRYHIVLPEDRSVIEWLLQFGYDESPPPGALEKIREAARELAPGGSALAIPPGEAGKLYTSPGEAGLDYITDRTAREYVRSSMKYLVADTGRLIARAAEGLLRALQVMAIAGDSPGWLEWRGEVPHFRYEISNVKYLIPLRIAPASGAGELDDEPSILVTITGPESTTKVEGKRITLSLSEGVLRFLAAVALAYEHNGPEAFDPTRVSERMRNLLRSTGLDSLLERAAEWMRSDGYIIEPLKHEASFGTLVGSLRDRFNAMRDVARFLIILGGHRKHIPTSMIVDTLWSIVAATPYSERSRWCGTRIPSVGSYSDIKDAARKEDLAKIVHASLNALRAENLLDISSGEEDSFRLVKDRIMERIERHNRERRGKRRREAARELAGQLFVLPSDETNRSNALHRIELRLAILNMLAPETRESLRTVASYTGQVRRALHEARSKAEELSRLIEDITGEPYWDALVSLIVCKKKDCKIIDDQTVDNLRRAMEGIIESIASSPDAFTHEARNLLSDAKELGTGVADLISIALDWTRNIIYQTRQKLEEIKSVLQEMDQSLRIISGSGLHLLVDTAIRAVENEMRDIEDEINSWLQQSLSKAATLVSNVRHAVEHGKRPEKEIREHFHFGYCDGKSISERMHIRRYSPVLVYLVQARSLERIEKRIGELRSRLARLREAASRLAEEVLKADEKSVEVLVSRAKAELQASTGNLLDAVISTMDRFSGILQREREERLERETAMERVRERVRIARENYSSALKSLEEAERIIKALKNAAKDPSLDWLLTELSKTMEQASKVDLEISSVEESCIESMLSSYKACESMAEAVYNSADRLRQQASQILTRAQEAEREILESLANRAQDLLVMLESYRRVLLGELQSGNERLEPVVEKIVGLKELLAKTLEKEYDVSSLSRVLQTVEKEWARIREEHSSDIRKAAQLLEILDSLRRGEKSLEDLLRQLPAGESVEIVLHRLADAARSAGFTIVVALRRLEKA